MAINFMSIYLHNKRQFSALLLVITAMIVVQFINCSRESHLAVLVELQEQSQFATTLAEKEAIIAKLESHYRSLVVSAKNRQKVDCMLNELEESLPAPFAIKQNSLHIKEEIRFEKYLDTLLTQVSLGQGDQLEAYWQSARETATTLDSLGGISYWTPFVEASANSDSITARAWKTAKIAKNLAAKYKSSAPMKADQFVGFALQNIDASAIPDKRTKFTTLQQLMVILTDYYRFFDISCVLAETRIPEAMSIGFYLRAAGLEYNYAEALSQADRVSSAHSVYQKNLERVKKYKKTVPSIDWYENASKIGLIDVFIDFGRHVDALKILASLDTVKTLSQRQKFKTFTQQGRIYTRLGKYENALESFQDALENVIENNDHRNHLTALNNLGDYYEQIGQYRQAATYYEKALAAHRKNFPEDKETRQVRLVRLAAIKALQGKKVAFRHMMGGVQNEAGNVINPVIKAEILRSLGYLYQENHQPKASIEVFQQAAKLYGKNGRIRSQLDTKVDLIRSLIMNQNTEKAWTLSKEVYQLSQELSYLKCQIDILALKARLAHQQNDYQQANVLTDKLLKIVSGLHQGFEDLDVVIGYRHRIDEYLREAVLYELFADNETAAYQKLKQAQIFSRQSTAQKSRVNGISNHIVSDTLARPPIMPIETLELNYFAADSNLYIFVRAKDTLLLKQRKIDSNILENRIDDFIERISKTGEVLNTQQPQEEKVEYHSETMRLGHQIFIDILGWPDLQMLITNADILHIIPNGPLHNLPFHCLPLDPAGDNFLVERVAIMQSDQAGRNGAESFKYGGNSFHDGRITFSADKGFSQSLAITNYLTSKFNAVPLSAPPSSDRPIDMDRIFNEDEVGYDALVVIAHHEVDPEGPNQMLLNLTVKQHSTDRFETIGLSESHLKHIDWGAWDAVLLIGCNTGSGQLFKGAGLYGLEQILSHNNITEILASRWEIDASKAIPQTQEYIKLRGQSLHPALALQAVQKKSIQEFKNDVYTQIAHPFYWAGLGLTVNFN